MKTELSLNEKESLEKQHRTERARRVADRIKAALLYSERWSYIDIAQALRIRPEIVYDHSDDYQESKKLKPKNGGAQSQVSEN